MKIKDIKDIIAEAYQEVLVEQSYELPSKAIAKNDERVKAVADAISSKFDIQNDGYLQGIIRHALADHIFENKNEDAINPDVDDDNPRKLKDYPKSFIKGLEDRYGKVNLDRDLIWSSCVIKDHPSGRQKAMLDLGLVESFNTLNYHPSDLKVLESNNLTIDKYKNMVNSVLLTE